DFQLVRPRAITDGRSRRLHAAVGASGFGPARGGARLRSRARAGRIARRRRELGRRARRVERPLPLGPGAAPLRRGQAVGRHRASRRRPRERLAPLRRRLLRYPRGTPALWLRERVASRAGGDERRLRARGWGGSRDRRRGALAPGASVGALVQSARRAPVPCPTHAQRDGVSMKFARTPLLVLGLCLAVLVA